MNKKILVTGGTGAMGSVLVRRLCELGEKVVALTLPGDPLVKRLDGTGAEIRYADIASVKDIDGCCEGVGTVVHCAAIIITHDPSLYEKINAQGTRTIVNEAKRAGVKHIIHISSASVLYTKPTPYSLSKQQAERAVMESGVPWTIIRPTLVYGKRGGQEFDMYIDYLRKFPIIPFIGSGNSIKRPVYVEDITNGLVNVAQKAQGANKVYNFSGGSAVSILDFSRMCLLLMNQAHKPIVHLPAWSCKLLASALKRIMKDPPLKWSVIAGITQDANLDPSEAMRDIGYTPSQLMDSLPGCFPRKS